MSNTAMMKWPEPPQGTHDGDFGGALGPAGEATGSRRTVVQETEIAVGLDQRAVGVASRPPGTQRVLQQEANHVVLGEQLRHRAEVGPADLALAEVDLVLLLRLPELIAPAQSVVGCEHVRRQIPNELLQDIAAFGCQARLRGGIVGEEDAGQHKGGITGSQFPGAGRAFLQSQLGAILQRDGHAVRVQEQVVLGQEAGEQHAVPLLVGDLLDQLWNAFGLAAAAELSGLGAEGAAEHLRLLAHRREGLRALDRKGDQGSLRRGFGRVAGGDDGAFEEAAIFGCEWRHVSWNSLRSGCPNHERRLDHETVWITRPTKATRKARKS